MGRPLQATPNISNNLMRKVRLTTNADRLKLCLIGHDYLYKELSINTPNIDISHIKEKLPFRLFGAVFGYDGGYIKVTDIERSTKGENEVVMIEAELYVDGLAYPYATITTDRAFMYMTISNCVFYQTLTTVGGKKISLLAILPNILETLRLDIRSVTWCDICVDANINLRKFILKALKDDSLLPIINGLSISDKRQPIQGYLKVYEGSRTGQVGKPSLYFKNYDDSIVVTCYNKLRELKTQGGTKDYIIDYNGWGQRGKMYRLEVRAKSAPIKSFCREQCITYMQFLSNLSDEDFRLRLFDWLVSKNIYFNTVEAYEKHKCDRRTLLSIAMGGVADNFGGKTI